MEHDYKEPVYTIGVVAKTLGVCPATLRIWERKGLIKPVRIGKDRFYSKNDLDRLEYIKKLIQKQGMNIEGVKGMLNVTKCWEIRGCNPKDRGNCKVYLKYAKA